METRGGHQITISITLCLFLETVSLPEPGLRMKPESPTDGPVSADLEARVTGMCKTPSFTGDRIQSKGS